MAFEEDSGLPPLPDILPPYPKFPISPSVANWNEYQAQLKAQQLEMSEPKSVLVDGNDIIADIVGAMLKILQSEKTKDANRVNASQLLWQILTGYPREFEEPSP